MGSWQRAKQTKSDLDQSSHITQSIFNSIDDLLEQDSINGKERSKSLLLHTLIQDLCTMYVSATYIRILELIAAQRELSALMSEAS